MRCRSLARQAPIDLVLLDLNMPCMGGMACLESPQAIDPKLKVVVASGQSAAVNPGVGTVKGAAAVLLKPYTLAKLQKVVRDALEADTA